MVVTMVVARHLQWVDNLVGIVITQEQEGLSRGIRMEYCQKRINLLEIGTLTNKCIPVGAVQIIEMVVVVVVINVSEEANWQDTEIRILPLIEMIGIMVKIQEVRTEYQIVLVHNPGIVEGFWERTRSCNLMWIMVIIQGIGMS